MRGYGSGPPPGPVGEVGEGVLEEAVGLLAVLLLGLRGHRQYAYQIRRRRGGMRGENGDANGVQKNPEPR